MNRTYCLPRASIIDRVTQFFGGAGSSTITGFDASVNCMDAQADNWQAVPASDRLLSTSDGTDVVLSTRGGELFVRE
jgi:hypothetical protein